MSSPALSPAALIAERPFSSYQRVVLGICLLIGLLDGYDALTIGYVIPAIAEDWGVSAGSLTPAVTAGLVGLVIGAITLGALGDRRGRRLVVITGFSVFAVFSGAIAFAPNMFTLAVLRFLAGVGLGAVLPSLIALSVEYSPTRRKALSAIVVGTSSVSLGGILGAALSAYLVPVFNWQSVFLVGGILPLLVLPLVVRLLPESLAFLSTPEREGEVRRVLARIDPELGQVPLALEPATVQSKAPLGVLFADRRAPLTILLWISYFCGYCLTFIVSTWMPALLDDAGQTSSVSIWATALSTVGAVIGAMTQGYFIDRRRQDYGLLGVGYLLGVPIIIALVNSMTSAPLVILFAVLLGLLSLAPVACMAALSANLYPASARATGVGWALTMARIGSIVGPLVVGILIQQGLAPSTIFSLACVPTGLAAVSVTVLARRARAELRRQSEIHVAADQKTHSAI